MYELEILKTLQPHDNDTRVQSILTLGFAPDSHHLASGGQKGALLIWDVTAGPHEELEQFSEPVESLAYSPDGSFLAYSTLDSAGVDVKNLLKRAKSPINLEVPGPAPAIAFHPRGEYLVVGADSLEINHIKERESVTMYNPGLSICVAISPDGAVLANGNDGGEVLRWDVHLGPTDGVPDEVDAPIRTLKGPPDVVTSVAFSPDNARLASSGNDGSVSLGRGIGQVNSDLSGEWRHTLLGDFLAGRKVVGDHGGRWERGVLGHSHRN